MAELRESVSLVSPLTFPVNMHFRCKVWQVQILDLIHRVLLPQHHSDLYEVIT